MNIKNILKSLANNLPTVAANMFAEFDPRDTATRVHVKVDGDKGGAYALLPFSKLPKAVQKNRKQYDRNAAILKLNALVQSNPEAASVIEEIAKGK